MKPTTLKIKTRIVFLTTLVFVVVVSVGSLFAGNVVFKHTQETLLQQQSLLQTLVVNQIDSGLQLRLDALQVISNQLHDGEALLDLQRMQQILDGRVILHRDFNGGMIIMDSDARMIIDSPIVPGRVGTDLSDRDHAKQVKATRKPMITHPLIGRGLQVPVFATSVPILADNGDFLGYLLGITRLNDSNQLTHLNQEVHGGTGNIYIIDFNNNVFVTSTRHYLAMKPLPSIDQSEILRRIHAGENQGLAQSFFDNRAAFSAQKLELIDWYVVHTIPEVIFNQSSWNLLKTLAWLGGLVALLFATLIYWVMRNQLKPLEQSAEKIHQMLIGSIPHAALPAPTKDEVGTLITAFNQKVAQLDQEATSRIRELNDHFMVILDNTTDYIYFKDASGRMKFCSQNLANLTGYSSWKEMEGKLDTEIFPADVAKVYAEEEEVVYKQGVAVINHVAPYENQAGERGWVQTNKWPVFSEDGKKVIGLFGISRDITKRVQLEESMQRAISALKQAESLARIGSWTLDLVNNELSWSDEAFNIFEIDKTKFVATYEFFLALVHPEDREEVNKAYKDSLRNKEKYSITHRLLMIDGRIKYVEEQGESTYDDAGNALRSYGAIQDITERWHAEQQLRIAASVFDSQEGMLVTDVEGTILRVNKAFTEITGYSEDEAVGQNPRILNSGLQSHDFYTAMWETILTEGRWEGEVWNRRKDGVVYPEYLRVTAVKDKNGTLSHYVGTIVDITQSKAAAEQIEFLAYYDPLTKLPNRRLLFERLNHALASSKRNGFYGALLFVDLDYFKVLNDAHGHPVGDILLQQVSTRLLNNLREGDTAARIGGDEFVILLENISEDPVEASELAELVAKKIHNQLNQPYQLDQLSYLNSSSIGITLFSGKELQGDELLTQADIAMYQAKIQGRNGIKFFDPKMQQQISAREELRQALQKALERNEFELYYQVQVDSKGQPIGVEALIRWNHPEKGTVPPINFIPLAEETQLILPIGQWVLETVCAQLQHWHHCPSTSHLVISINVSAIEFRQSNFVELILTTLEKYAIDPSKLKLELTESILIESVDDTISKMQSLSQAGIRFSLDDFGTGYSSLQYLKKLPIDQLKIDQSFVRDIYQDNNDRTIVKTIISMAQGLGIDVIAEGVETQAQKDFLHRHGCEHYQGYLFGKPLPLREFEGLLK